MMNNNTELKLLELFFKDMEKSYEQEIIDIEEMARYFNEE